MAQETFAQLWNKVLLYAPDTPVPIVQEAIKRTYRSITSDHYWSELRVDGEQLIPTTVGAGTVTVTQGSLSEVGVATGWTADFVGRQFAYGSLAPWYTIEAINTGTQTITLDRAFEMPTVVGTTYSIGQWYLEFPKDLRVLLYIRQRNNAWRITPHYYTQEYIDRVDPYRSSAGTPVCIVAAPSRIDPLDNTTIPRYELWPRVTTETLVMYRYYKIAELVNPTDMPIQVLKPEALIYGALKELAMYPGNGQKPNPLFNMDAYKMYKDAYDEAIQNSETSDIDRDQRMIDYNSAGLRYPMDLKYWQNHAF